MPSFVATKMTRSIQLIDITTALPSVGVFPVTENPLAVLSEYKEYLESFEFDKARIIVVSPIMQLYI
jgi:hypothetical protein